MEETPLATPDRSPDTSDRITLVNCELAKPSPMPNPASPGTICQNLIPGATAQITSPNDTVSMISPVLMMVAMLSGA